MSQSTSNRTFYCSLCSRVFTSTSGLTRHLEDSGIHNPHSRIISRGPVAIHHTGTPSNQGIPPDIAILPTTYPCPDIPFNLQLTDDIEMWSSNEDENYSDDEDKKNDSDDDDKEDEEENEDEDEDEENEENDDEEVVGLDELSEELSDDDVEIVSHDKGGYIYDLDKDDKDDSESDNLFYPWANEDELWLSNFLFKNISSSVANTILEAITTGRLFTRLPIRFKNVREMHSIIDQGADIVKMVSYYISIIFIKLYLIIIILFYFIL